MKRNGRKKLGAWGESVAAHHLSAKGYEIMARNWRCSLGEIDLIVKDGAVIFLCRGQNAQRHSDGVTRRRINGR